MKYIVCSIAKINLLFKLEKVAHLTSIIKRNKNTHTRSEIFKEASDLVSLSFSPHTSCLLHKDLLRSCRTNVPLCSSKKVSVSLSETAASKHAMVTH